MLQRTARIIISPLWRAGERHLSGDSCQCTQYGWKSSGRNTGVRCLSPWMRATYPSTNNHQRPWVNSHSWQHHHYQHPIPIGKMSTSHLLSVPMSSETSPLPLWAFPDTTVKECHVRLYSTTPPPLSQSPVDKYNMRKGAETSEEKRKTEDEDNENKEEKMSVVQKFKLMYKQYWYVLIPVHVVTSVVWYGSFFIAAKSGVDIVPLMEKLGAGEKILSHLQNSNAGYYAIAYAMYKIATPARYTVTIGGTTISINYLKKRGYIKPVPSAEQLKEMYEGKREELMERKDEIVEKYHEKKGEIVERYQEKKEEMFDRYQEKKEEMVERYQEKRVELRDKVAEKKGEFREKVEEGREKLDQVKGSLRKRR